MANHFYFIRNWYIFGLVIFSVNIQESWNAVPPEIRQTQQENDAQILKQTRGGRLFFNFDQFRPQPTYRPRIPFVEGPPPPYIHRQYLNEGNYASSWNPLTWITMEGVGSFFISLIMQFFASQAAQQFSYQDQQQQPMDYPYESNDDWTPYDESSSPVGGPQFPGW